MNKFMFASVVVCLGLLLMFVSFGKETEQTKKSLTVGTNAEFPPFTFMEKGEIVGFDIDIAKEVCRRLGKECVFKDMPFEALIPEATFGSVDFVAAGLNYTPERAQRVLFTKPYLSADPLVILTLSKEGSAHSITLNDLHGKTVVVNEGFTADLYVTPIKEIKLVRLATTADAFLALKTGRVDAFVTAKSTVDMFMETQNAKLFQESIIPDANENCAIAVPKKYPELLIQIQHALDEMTNDGTIASLKLKWKLQ